VRRVERWPGAEPPGWILPGIIALAVLGVALPVPVDLDIPRVTSALRGSEALAPYVIKLRRIRTCGIDS
jgi:hypothetical protein